MKEDSYKSIALSLVAFSLPLILSGVLQQLYSWADAFIVGNTEGSAALAAIGSTTAIINFFVNAITGFTLGLSILFAQRYGSGNRSDIRKLLSSFLVILGLVFLILAVLGFLFTGNILRLLDTTPDTFDKAYDYLRIIFIGIPFLAVYNVYAAALRALGNSRAPFYGVLISSVSNVILDIIAVVFLGMSVKGAAIATIISQIAMTIFIVIYSSRKYEELRFAKPDFQKAAIMEGVKFGCPPMIQSTVSSAGGLVLQNFMNGFGTATVAAITTAYRVDSIILLPIINLGAGISTFTAQSFGARNDERTKRTFFSGLMLMAAVSLLLSLVVIPAGGFLIALFGAGDEAVAIGDAFFRRIASFYVIFGLATAIRGYIEGIGDVVYSSIAGILSLLCRIVLSYVLEPYFGNMVIAYAEMLSWILLLLLYLVRAVYKSRQMRSLR